MVGSAPCDVFAFCGGEAQLGVNFGLGVVINYESF